MAIRPRQLSNGKTVYDVTIYVGKDAHGNRPRITRTAKTKAAARNLEAALKAKYSALNAHSATSTLADYIEAYYWPSAVKRLAATSLDTYEKEIRLRILPTLGDMKLADIDRQAVQSMVDGCATCSVARSAIGVLKTILNEAIADDFIIKNPAMATLALPRARGRKRDNGLVLSTFAQIRAALEVVDARGSVCIQRIAYTGLLLGLRPEERYALNWSSFDMNAKTVTISHACIAASAKHGGVQLKTTKTKHSARTIPMHPDFYAWLVHQPCANQSAPFILGESGKRISPSTAQHRWKHFLNDNPDMPLVTIENMRHSFATAYLAAGGRIETLSRILGHSNIHTTINRYYRPDLGILRAEMDAITHD